MKLILVGGFLGAGKTTLLREAARRLAQQGKSVGLVTNDQAPELVDTAWLSGTPASVREVAGSCFCCNFGGLRDAVESSEAAGAEYVIAEPVGSCTDLSATVIQPLKEHHPEWRVAPLSVLVDPLRMRGVLQKAQPLLDVDAAYILRLQLEEADRILLTKSDTLSEAQREEMRTYLRAEFPHAPVDVVSALSGEGVDAWLEMVLTMGGAGARIVDVDYDRYAHGEAVLGWLNAVLQLRWTGSLEPEWEDFVGRLFSALRDRLREKQCEIGHIKMLLETVQGRLMANLTGLQEELQVRREGTLERLNSVLTVNARVQASPEDTESIFRGALDEAVYGRVGATFRALHCIRPGRPVPTYRYTSVVP